MSPCSSLSLFATTAWVVPDYEAHLFFRWSISLIRPCHKSWQWLPSLNQLKCKIVHQNLWKQFLSDISRSMEKNLTRSTSWEFSVIHHGTQRKLAPILFIRPSQFKVTIEDTFWLTVTIILIFSCMVCNCKSWCKNLVKKNKLGLWLLLSHSRV